MLSDNPADETGKSPWTFFNAFARLAPNSGFRADIAKNESEIVEILQIPQPPSDLEEALFIVNLYGARKDLIGMVKAISKGERMRQDNFKCAMHDKMTEAVQEFVRRAGEFYGVVHSYQTRFLDAVRWGKVSDGLYIPNLLIHSPFHYDTTLSSRTNAVAAYASFSIHLPHWRKFLNFLYVDGETGEKFLERTFKEITNDFMWVSKEAKKMKEYLDNSEKNKTMKEITELNAIVHGIMMKYSAATYWSLNEIVKYVGRHDTAGQ